MLDALNSTDHFGRSAQYEQPLELGPGPRATFYDAGHILGSASLLLEVEERGRCRSILFSGDLGNAGRPLLRDPFHLPGLHCTRETAQSIALHQVNSGAVILAGSGMCTGGRVRHHWRHNLWREESSIVFVGFAARGTLARRIIDGAAHVGILREDIPVKTQVHTINGFSAHADREELLAWHRRTGSPDWTFLVHGEEDVMSALSKALHGTRVEMPAEGQSYAL